MLSSIFVIKDSTNYFRHTCWSILFSAKYVVKSFRRRTSGVRHVLEKRSSRRNSVKRSRTQHVQNPTIQALKEIELTEIKKVSARSQPETLPLSRVQSKRRSTMSKNKKKEDPKKPQREKSATQQMRKERVKSLHTKRESCEMDGKSLFYMNPSRVKKNPLSVGARSGGGEEKGTAGRRQSFRVVEDVEGDYFENVETGNTVWDLPEDGDLVGMERGTSPVEGRGEEKSTAGRRQSFRVVEDVEGDYFENVETGNTVWDLPEDGDLVEMEHVAI